MTQEKGSLHFPNHSPILPSKASTLAQCNCILLPNSNIFSIHKSGSRIFQFKEANNWRTCFLFTPYRYRTAVFLSGLHRQRLCIHSVQHVHSKCNPRKRWPAVHMLCNLCRKFDFEASWCRYPWSACFQEMPATRCAGNREMARWMQVPGPGNPHR